MYDLKEFKFIVEYGSQKHRVKSNIYIQAKNYDEARNKLREFTTYLKGAVKIIEEIDTSED